MGTQRPNNQHARERASFDYATRADFCHLFRDSLDSLYRLAFMITANHADAEECLLLALSRALIEKYVFKEFAFTWSKRALIICAIKIAFERSDTPAHKRDLWRGDFQSASDLINGLTQCEPVERVAFVMAVLERISLTECALLLGLTRQGVAAAQVRALEHVAASNHPDYRGTRLAEAS